MVKINEKIIPEISLQKIGARNAVPASSARALTQIKEPWLLKGNIVASCLKMLLNTSLERSVDLDFTFTRRPYRSFSQQQPEY